MILDARQEHAATPRGWRLGLGLAAILALAACDREVPLEGPRFDARAVLSGSEGATAEAAEADAARPISLPGTQRLTLWEQRGFNAANRVPHAALGASPQQIWSVDIGQGNSRRQRITADPVAADGRVFTLDADAGLRATSVASGAALWSVDLTPGFDRGGGVSGGGLALSGGRLFVTTGYGELVALNAADGGILWRQRLDAGIAAPTVSGGTVFVVSRDNRAWAIDAENGRIDWRLPTTDGRAVLSGGAAPALTNRLAIFPFGSGEMVATLRNSGVRIWATAVAGGRLGVAYSNINDITGDPVVVGGTIYAGNQSGRVVALDADAGTRRWTATEGAYSPVLPVGNSLFFVSDRNELIRIDAANGARVWGTELPLYVQQRERRRRAVFTHYGPILAGGRLVVASGDERVRLFSPESGALVGTLELRDGAAAHPIVVNDTLLVVTEDGRLTAFR